MKNLIVVDDVNLWPLQISGVEVVSAREYLNSDAFKYDRHIKVFNLCRSYRYQTLGYYVSLIATARRHKPSPSISTIQDMKSQSIIRIASDDLDELIQKSITGIRSSEFVLSIYFGQNIAKRYERLSTSLFRMFSAPFVKVVFRYTDKWYITKIGSIAADEIPESHLDFVIEAAKEYFSGKRGGSKKKSESRYDMAILVNPVEELPPSNEKALKRFIKAAKQIGFEADLITKEDYGHLAEFDALFIRETTNVNHHTYRMARKAEAEGLIVMDDPGSILKCSNKVFLAELMQKNKIMVPNTMIVYKDNRHSVPERVGLPCILKQPDSYFSQGVYKVENEEQLHEITNHMLSKSELIIAQSFLPTEYDWRIGILDKQPLFACRYYMARKHWQIIKHGDTGNFQEGKSETMPIEIAPRKVVSTALKAANLIGDGLYGVDLKEKDGEFYIIEVNDNPNIDAGVEDEVLKENLYKRIMESFMRRVVMKREGRMPL